MSQFLGAGHSGVFSIDHKSAPEPYFVCGRADYLDSLAKSPAGSESTSFGLVMPEDYSPQKPPEVKWVNWRWPRYEWNTKVSGVRAYCQWIVHDNTVLQQLVLENSNEAPKDDFWLEARNDMFIRDLDYLDSSYHFNENQDGYNQFQGPNGFGCITVNELEYSTPSGEPNDMDSINGRGFGKSSTSQEGIVSDPMEQAPPTNKESSAEQARLGGRLSADLNQDLDARGTAGNTPISVKNPMERTGHIEDTWSANKAHSVASVMALYCNGKAQQMRPRSTERCRHKIPGRNPETESGILEIVVAYKLVIVPEWKVHWRKFLVTAEEADVNRILREETGRVWGKGEDGISTSIPLWELGLSMIDPDKSTRKTETGTTNSDDVDPDPEESSQDVPSLVQKPSMKVDSDARPVLEPPKGSPGKSSPKHHIEYMAWRHLEHVLSVCAVPLLPCNLLNDAGPVGDGEEIVALTCGDMSGHRICTSASL